MIKTGAAAGVILQDKTGALPTGRQALAISYGD
jgi:hypothetical protein